MSEDLQISNSLLRDVANLLNRLLAFHVPRDASDWDKGDQLADQISAHLASQGDRDEDHDNHDCLAKRRPGEPMFIVLARDPDAHNLVRLWAERRLLAGGDPEHCRMGLDTAAKMQAYAADPENRPASAPAATEYPPLAPSQAGPGQGWRPTHFHVKTRRLYRLVSSAILQTGQPVGDEAFLALYQGENGLFWVRPAEEFWDGRFALAPVPDWLKVEPHRFDLTDEEKDRILAEEGLASE